MSARPPHLVDPETIRALATCYGSHMPDWSVDRCLVIPMRSFVTLKSAYRDGYNDGRSGQDHSYAYPWILEAYYKQGLEDGAKDAY